VRAPGCGLPVHCPSQLCWDTAWPCQPTVGPRQGIRPPRRPRITVGHQVGSFDCPACVTTGCDPVLAACAAPCGSILAAGQALTSFGVRYALRRRWFDRTGLPRPRRFSSGELSLSPLLVSLIIFSGTGTRPSIVVAELVPAFGVQPVFVGCAAPRREAVTLLCRSTATEQASLVRCRLYDSTARGHGCTMDRARSRWFIWYAGWRTKVDDPQPPTPVGPRGRTDVSYLAVDTNEQESGRAFLGGKLEWPAESGSGTLSHRVG